MSRIKRYNNFINESNDEKSKLNTKQDIVDIMSDLIDDKYYIRFIGITGGEISGKNIYEDLDKFNPVSKTGLFIRSKFNIIIDIKSRNYKNYCSLINEMEIPIDRLKNLGWNLSRFTTKSEPANPTNNCDGEIISANYLFEKPDIELDDENYKPNITEIRDSLSKIGLSDYGIDINPIDDKSKEKWSIHIVFETSGYSGELPRDIEDRFDEVCDELGFTSYDYDIGTYSVTFYV